MVLLSPEDFSGIPYNEINVKEAKGKKLGEIKWHSIRSTRLIIGGKELKIRNFIKENKMSDEDRALGKWVVGRTTYLCALNVASGDVDINLKEKMGQNINGFSQISPKATWW